MAPRSRTLRMLAAGILAAFGFFQPPARAIIEAADGSAAIRIPDSEVRSVLEPGNFCAFVWVWRASNAAPEASVISLPGVLDLRILGKTEAVATVHQTGGFPQNLSVSAPGNIPLNQWTLMAVSFDRAAGRLDLWHRSESTQLRSGTSSSPQFAGANLGPSLADFTIGNYPGGVPAMIGAYGLICFRGHTITAQDFADVWASRRYFAPYDLDNTASGGSMNGWQGCLRMFNHAMTTKPVNDGVGGGAAEQAAIVGSPVGFRNIHVYRGPTPPGGDWDEFRTIRPAVAASGFTYRSHRDAPYATFFGTDTPDFGPAAVPTAAFAPRARQLATGPQQLLRVMVSANSRAVRLGDGSQQWPGNYAHGFIDAQFANTAGTLFRPAIINSSGNPWFGIDLKERPRNGPEGQVLELRNIDAPWSDFTRFFTGADVGTGVGPASGVRLAPGAYYGARCKPEPGSLLVADQPLVYEAYFLRYPGSSTVTWAPDRGPSQKDPGQQGSPTHVSLDTTAFIFTFTASDKAPNHSTLVLKGDFSQSIKAGHACFIYSGSGKGAISLVGSATFDGTSTTVSLLQPLGALPKTSSELRFGPWGYETITYECPAVPENDPNVWRGVQFTAGPGGGGVILFAVSAWRPGVPGFVFGTAGWGGHGYGEQIDSSFDAVIKGWMALSNADVWIQAPAQQNAFPAIMGQFADYIRAALPATDLVWAGEMAHGKADYDKWHTYIVENAPARGIVGLTALRDPRLGTFMEQLGDGLRSDIAHVSRRGNRVLADIWTGQLAQAALDDCSAPDFDGDGALSVFDFLAFQNAWLIRDPAGDYNLDGVFDIFDFLAFQSDFASCK